MIPPSHLQKEKQTPSKVTVLQLAYGSSSYILTFMHIYLTIKPGWLPSPHKEVCEENGRVRRAKTSWARHIFPETAAAQPSH